MKRQQSEEIIKELRDLSPRLSQLERGNAFDVPEGYFDELEARIMAASSSAGRTRTLPLRRVLAWAASFLLLVTAAWATYHYVVVPAIEDRRIDQQEQLSQEQDNATTAAPESTIPETMEGAKAGNLPVSHSDNTPGQLEPATSPQGSNSPNGTANASPSSGNGSQTSQGQFVAPSGTNPGPGNPTAIITSPAKWNDTLVCLGARISYRSAIAGSEYLWSLDGKSMGTSRSASSQVIDTRKTGTGNHAITLKVRNQNGNLLHEQRASIRVVEAPVLSLGEDRCVEAGYILPGSDIRSHSNLWSDGSSARALKIAKPGTYWLRTSLQELPSCSSTDTVILSVNTPPSDQFPASLSYCSDDRIRLSVKDATEGNEYSWEPGNIEGETLYLHDLLPGSYTYSLITTVCDISYREDIRITIQDCGLEIPNVFTPNGDGANDRFEIRNIDLYPGAYLAVFDRNGRKVFEDNNYHNTWDGANCDAGTYYYILRINKGLVTERSGSISIVR